MNTEQTTGVAPRHNVYGYRCATNFIIRFPTLSLLLFLSLFLDETGKVRERENGHHGRSSFRFDAVLYNARKFNRKVSSFGNQPPLTVEEKVFTYGDFMTIPQDMRFMRVTRNQVVISGDQDADIDLWILNRSIKLEIVWVSLPQIETKYLASIENRDPGIFWMPKNLKLRINS